MPLQEILHLLYRSRPIATTQINLSQRQLRVREMSLVDLNKFGRSDTARSLYSFASSNL